MIVSEKTLLGVFLVFGMMLGAGATYLVSGQDLFSSKMHCDKQSHKLIHRHIDCMDTDSLYAKVTATEQTLEREIERAVAENKATRVSVFYRDLNSNRWFGVNPDTPFAPGSLLKLPLAIAYYKLSEVNPNALTEVMPFVRGAISLNEMQHIKPQTPLVPGQNYSIEHMIEHMIIESDNDVVPILGEHINKDFYEKVNLDLGVHFPTSGGIEQDFITVRTYAGILRTLYLSSYLNADNSNKVLDIMTKSTFKQGIGAGLPEGVLYANKFGDRGFSDPIHGSTYELHDCGIVYKPERPYIICVMSSGKDWNDLELILRELSRTVYENQ